jgi:hypothetical protein
MKFYVLVMRTSSYDSMPVTPKSMWLDLLEGAYVSRPHVSAPRNESGAGLFLAHFSSHPCMFKFLVSGGNPIYQDEEC